MLSILLITFRRFECIVFVLHLVMYFYLYEFKYYGNYFIVHFELCIEFEG
jgi:hypothetical protein